MGITTSMSWSDHDSRRDSRRKISWSDNMEVVVGEAYSDYDRTPIEVTPLCMHSRKSSTGAFGFTRFQLVVLFFIWILYVISLLAAVLYFNGYFT